MSTTTGLDAPDRPDGRRGACFRLSLPQGAPLEAVTVAPTQKAAVS